jgi:arylsulfatase A-like enzyme
MAAMKRKDPSGQLAFVETTASLILIGTATGFLGGIVFVGLFWLRYDIIYSLADGATTLLYLAFVLAALHSSIMTAAGLPVFLLFRWFRLAEQRPWRRWLPELSGLVVLSSYYCLLPQLVPLVKGDFGRRGTWAHPSISDHWDSLAIGLALALLLPTAGTAILRKTSRRPLSKTALAAAPAFLFVAACGVLLINLLFPDLYRFSAHYRADRTHAAESEVTGEAGSETDRLRNIILITYDALRSDHLSSFGYERETSPFVDALIARSASFSNVTVPYPQTSQSFASLFTGTYPWHHGVWSTHTVLPDGLVTLAEELGDHGYRSYAVASNINLDPRFNFDQGFDEYVVKKRSESDPVSVTEAALGLLRKGLERPFFLWVHYLDPHAPYEPPEELARGFFADERYRSDLDPGNYRENLRGRTPTVAHIAASLARYDGEILRQDRELHRLFAALEQQQYLEDTLVVFTSDHGESMGQHGYYFNHGPSPYRELQVPLFFHSPGIIPPRRVDDPVELVDIVPTMFGILGITPLSMSLAGMDLSAFVTDGGAEVPYPRRYALGVASVTDQTGLPQFFILRSRDWQLIVNKLDHIKRVTSWRQLVEFSLSVYKLRGQGTELYAMATGSPERRNVAPDHPELVGQLRGELGAMLADHTARRPNREVPVPVEEMDEATVEALRALGYIE